MRANGGPARLVRVYGLWIVLVTAVVMVAAYGMSRKAPVEYKSSAIVVVEARVRANTTPLPPDMGTEKELARSGLVVDPAARKLGMDSPDLVKGLVVSVAPDADVLTFSYTATDPRTAQRRAAALAAAYVDYRNAGEANESSSAAKRAAAASTQHATLVTPAGLPDKPVSRPIWIDLAVGLVVGLLLGVGTALIRDRLSDRIRGLADFERVAGITVLATVPRLPWRLRRKPLPITLCAPQSPVAESYRYLRSRLQPLLCDGDSTILVASAGEGEGRTTTAANLASALALAGRTVILVDADLRKPHLHTVFGLDNGPGLVDLLAGNATPDDVLRPSPVPQLRLVTAGPGAGFAADLLEGPRLERTLRALQKKCDIVVLDSAPLLSVADGIALAALSDHVLLVGDYSRTTRGYVSRAVAELGEVVDSNISGVLLKAPKSAGGLTPRGRPRAATPISAEAGDTVVLTKQEPEADRDSAPPPPATVPAAATTAPAVHQPAEAAAVSQPSPRKDLERHT